MVFFTGIFGLYYRWLAAVTDEYIRIHRPGPNDGVHEICRQTMPPSPSMINMHTQPMPVYISATASRPAPGRIHISANPNPLVTPVRPIYGQQPQQSTSLAGIQPVTNPIMNLSGGMGNGAMTMSPQNSTFQPVGHESIALGLPSANPPTTFSPTGSAFQTVGHQSIPLRPAAVNPTMTSLAPASAFIPVSQQSIHLTPGSVNQAMTMSAPPSSVSPVPASVLQVVPNQAITVAASPVNPPTVLQHGPISPHGNQFQSLTNPIGSPPNPLQQGTMSPHANQFQSLTNLLQGTMSPHANQFQSLTNMLQGTMSPQGNQLNPIGSPAMTIEELKIRQSSNMTPNAQMVPSEVQMGEIAPTGQQVPIHILNKLDRNQLQQLQSGSPVPITENQLQEIQGGPVDDSQMDLLESGDEDQIGNEEPIKKSEDMQLHQNPIDSRKYFTPETFKMKYAPSGSIEYDNDNDVEVIEDDGPKDLEVVPEDFESSSENSDGDPTYQPDTDEDDTDEEEISTISSPFQQKSTANDGRSKSAPAESTIMQGKYRYVKINSDF